MRNCDCSRRIAILSVVLACALIAGGRATAGEVPWDELTRGVDETIVVDHQPYNFGGGASDTLFQENEFLPPTWQLTADDFLVAETLDVHRIEFWGFYDQNSVPMSDEQFRVRLYEGQSEQNVPGQLLYESNFTNVPRSFTGRQIVISGAPAEFRFSINVEAPIHLIGNTTYWLEIAQNGSIESHFRWEFSRNGELDGQAYVNPSVQDWTHSAGDSDAAYQLIAIPEPACILLLLPCVVAFLHRRRRR